MIVILTIYITIIAGLLYGRLQFFKASAGSKVLLVIYDPIVAVHIGYSIWALFSGSELPLLISVISIVLMTAGIALYWWAINTSFDMDLALIKSDSKVITTGPYALVRHPFYVSYVLIWTSTSILFNSIILWITLFYLSAFYLITAINEEKAFKRGRYSREYEHYSQNVGMFLPRINNGKVNF